jgi:carbonic anhydrase/acetyltransferase-like protein (isoleucine patch superfamily)
MIITHLGKSPKIHSSAFIAPSATICGQVSIGSNSCVMHGATIIAEGGSIRIGEQCIIFENALIRSNTGHDASIGKYSLIGPNTHIAGCTIEDEVFIATGAAIFHGAFLGKGSVVKVNGIVHLKSYLSSKSVVPIGWIAVGNPAEILPLEKHEEILMKLDPLNFPLTVYGVDREEWNMKKVTRIIADRLVSHGGDEIISKNLNVKYNMEQKQQSRNSYIFNNDIFK